MSDKSNNSIVYNKLEWSMFTVLAGLLFFLSFLAVVWLLLDLLAPIFVGFLLALIISPLVEWLYDKFHIPRILTVLLFLLVLAGIVTGLSVWLVPRILQQLSLLIQNLPGYIERLMELISGQEISLSQDLRDEFTNVAGGEGNLLSTIMKGAARSVDILFSAFGRVIYITIYTVLLVVFFVGFSIYIPSIQERGEQYLPASQKDHIKELLHKIHHAAGTFLRTRLIIAVILSAMFSVGWAIAGVPYWLLLGIATGILNIVPYASGLGWLGALLINVLEATNGGGSFLHALIWPTIVFVLVQGVDGWVLTPYLQGESLNIHPLMVLFAVLAGGTLAGLLGMLLALPITAACQIIYSEVIKGRLIHWAKSH